MIHIQIEHLLLFEYFLLFVYETLGVCLKDNEIIYYLYCI